MNCSPIVLDSCMEPEKRNLFESPALCFEICPKCTAEQATPDHILACLPGAFPTGSCFLSSIDFGFLQGAQAHGPDIALLIFGDRHHYQQQSEFQQSSNPGTGTTMALRSRWPNL
ncbi:hypothetical protein AVEN_2995-1 [Araneus ventricosus]|uniref:Uncharacterized protein n=1 Tax=Araneus ventricosus TaxID=182803 RepID=A0A4Y2X984_ARAVE|nr:hypothetical protein AVEN_2995-1 [Araneus ventricosus]